MNTFFKKKDIQILVITIYNSTFTCGGKVKLIQYQHAITLNRLNIYRNETELLKIFYSYSIKNKLLVGTDLIFVLINLYVHIRTNGTYRVT